MPHLLALHAVSLLQPQWLQEVLNSYATDTQSQELLAQLAISSPNSQGFYLDQGIIKKGTQIWVGNNSALQTKLIAAFHSSALGGHSGVGATYHRMRKLFYWKGLKADVDNFVKQCEICQKSKHSTTLPAGLLQPLPIPSRVWQDISMDFIEGLPKSEGYTVILVIIDRLTKYGHFIPLKHPYTATIVAHAFLDNIVKLYGLPRSIVSDRDQIFTSRFWQHLFTKYKITLSLSTAYHPQTDGQTERLNQCLEMYVRCAVQDAPTTWKAWLPLAQIWYNSSHHSALGCSPAKALYGIDPNLGGYPLTTPDTPIEVAEVITHRAEHLELLKQRLLQAQNRMKVQADKHRLDKEFSVGDQVLLKLQPYTQSSVAS